MRDCTLLVKCVEYLISVVLLTGREYNDLKVFRHRAQKLFSIRSNVEDHLKGHILQFLLWRRSIVLRVELYRQISEVVLLFLPWLKHFLILYMRVDQSLIQVKNESVSLRRCRQQELVYWLQRHVLVCAEYVERLLTNFWEVAEWQELWRRYFELWFLLFNSRLFCAIRIYEFNSFVQLDILDSSHFINDQVLCNAELENLAVGYCEEIDVMFIVLRVHRYIISAQFLHLIELAID